eukprot:ANDGO_02140.mRNA.1 Kinesin-related protein 4
MNVSVRLCPFQTQSSGILPLFHHSISHSNPQGQVLSISDSPSLVPGSTRSFPFSAVYENEASQLAVFDGESARLTDVLFGSNAESATIALYGCSSAAKKFTLEGPPEHPGLLYRCLDRIFNRIAQLHVSQPAVTYAVKLQCYQIVHEQFKDLMNLQNSSKLKLRDDAKRGVLCEGATEMILRSPGHGFDLVSNLRRESHSIAHTVFVVIVEKSDSPQNAKALTLLNFASPESAIAHVASQGSGGPKVPLGNDLKWYSVLQSIVSALDSRAPYVQFHKSKVTMLLRDSLSGRYPGCVLGVLNPLADSLELTNAMSSLLSNLYEAVVRIRMTTAVFSHKTHGSQTAKSAAATGSMPAAHGGSASLPHKHGFGFIGEDATSAAGLSMEYLSPSKRRSSADAHLEGQHPGDAPLTLDEILRVGTDFYERTLFSGGQQPAHEDSVPAAKPFRISNRFLSVNSSKQEIVPEKQFQPQFHPQLPAAHQQQSQQHLPSSHPQTDQFMAPLQPQSQFANQGHSYYSTQVQQHPQQFAAQRTFEGQPLPAQTWTVPDAQPAFVNQELPGAPPGITMHEMAVHLMEYQRHIAELESKLENVVYEKNSVKEELDLFLRRPSAPSQPAGASSAKSASASTVRFSNPVSSTGGTVSSAGASASGPAAGGAHGSPQGSLAGSTSKRPRSASVSRSQGREVAAASSMIVDDPKALRERLQRAEATARDYDKYRQVMEASFVKLREELDAKNAELETKEKHIKALEKRSRETMNESQRASLSAKEYEKKIQTLEDENTKLHKEVKALKKEIGVSQKDKSRVKLLEAEVSSLQSLKPLEAEVQNLRALKRDLESNLSLRDQELANNKSLIHRLLEDIKMVKESLIQQAHHQQQQQQQQQLQNVHNGSPDSASASRANMLDKANRKLATDLDFSRSALTKALTDNQAIRKELERLQAEKAELLDELTRSSGASPPEQSMEITYDPEPEILPAQAVRRPVPPAGSKQYPQPSYSNASDPYEMQPDAFAHETRSHPAAPSYYAPQPPPPSGALSSSSSSGVSVSSAIPPRASRSIYLSDL